MRFLHETEESSPGSPMTPAGERVQELLPPCWLLVSLANSILLKNNLPDIMIVSKEKSKG